MLYKELENDSMPYLVARVHLQNEQIIYIYVRGWS